MITAWKALMNEADASAEVHQTVHDELENDIVPAIKSWQKGKYVKSMMHIKCTKEYEEEFKRVRCRIALFFSRSTIRFDRHKNLGRNCTSKSINTNVNITEQRKMSN